MILLEVVFHLRRHYHFNFTRFWKERARGRGGCVYKCECLEYDHVSTNYKVWWDENIVGLVTHCYWSGCALGVAELKLFNREKQCVLI